ncbi:MAG: hypothetical protein WBZ36_27140 [Candidatus Nitrosopolaris sp.]
MPLILLNGMHQVILKVITAVGRKDKACAVVKNYMSTFAISYYDKNGSRSQNMLKDKRRSYEQHSIE